jgi:hypothetical protein
MKRAVTSLVLAVVLGGSLATVGQASVKSGATCAPLGKTIIQASLKYTCIKSGKNFVWSKGVKVSTPVAPSHSASPTSTNSFTLRGSYPVATANYNAVIAELKARGSNGLALQIYSSPHFNPTFINMSTYGIYRAMDYWSDVYKPDFKLPIFFVDPRDAAWFNDEFPKHISDPDYLNAFNSDYASKATNYGAGDASTDLATGHPYISYVYTSDYQPNFGSVQIGAHEYTHDVQHTFNLGKTPTQFPCWTKEGQAMFFGISLSATSLNDYLNVRYKYFQDNPESRTDLPQTHIDWVDYFTKAEENKRGCAAGGIYESGELAFEYLFSLHGKQGMIDLWKSIETAPDFDTALFNVFGRHRTDLYKAFGDYIESQLVEFRKSK